MADYYNSLAVCCYAIILLITVSTVTSERYSAFLKSKITASGTSQLNFEPWYNHEDREKICNQVPYSILRCPNNKSVFVPESYCVTFDETRDLLEVGKCMYGKITEKRLKYPIAKESIRCREMNRTGTLCSKCQDGHYPLVYSYDMNCVECQDGKSNWWKFVLAAFLPLTVFYFIVLLFRINITSSYLLGFVFHAQAISAPGIARYIVHAFTGMPYNQELLRLTVAVYGIWNLDFLRSMQLGICLGTDALQTLALDLAVGIYPLLLMVMSYLLIHLYDRNFRLLVIIWKPFRVIFGLFQKNWDVKTSLIDSFAAFFFLSNVKFVNVSFDLLAPVRVYQLDSAGNFSSSLRVYYNASLPYLGETHLPYAVLAIAVLVLFELLPILLLILYPFRWFQKFLNLFPARWYILHTFMDSLHGCFKDGTQPGTRDCRWFASMPFIVHLLMYIIGIFILNRVSVCFSNVTLVLYIIIIVNLEPFKNGRHADIYTIFTLFTATWLACTILYRPEHYHQLVYSIAIILCVLPFCFALHWMYRHRKFGLQLIRKLRAWRLGYEALD